MSKCALRALLAPLKPDGKGGHTLLGLLRLVSASHTSFLFIFTDITVTAKHLNFAFGSGLSEKQCMGV